MDKNTAKNIIENANMSIYDIAHSIYMATVEGVSGANQNEGYGFSLSAIAELWNIRGSVGNPNGKTKITGRYKGMGVTEDMILSVIQQYPYGIQGSVPIFDSLLKYYEDTEYDIPGDQQIDEDIESVENIPLREELYRERPARNKTGLALVIAGVAIAVCRMFFGWGWIVSIIVGVILLGVIGSEG